jgi:PAS domain S-box-containing protein
VITLALLVGGFLFYRSQERQQRSNAQESLTAVSLSKVEQISRWRQSLIGDAAVWSEDSVLVGYILRYLSAPTPAGRAALRSGLLAWKTHKDYADLAVADPRGNVVFSLSGETGPLPRDEAAALQEALGLHRPVLTSLHREPGVGPHITAVAPLFTTFGGTPTTGAVILQCDAASTLYPLIVSWPTASRTAETLLVRRDGDAMLVLNELRHQTHTALELRLPMTRRDSPAVMAGAGKTGFVEGVDYRGVPVLADIRAVPGSPWFAVTKIDTAEAMATWRTTSIQLGCLLAGLLAAISALFFALWQARAKTQYKRLLESRTARLAAAASLAAVIDCSVDPIIATTLDGVVTAWNQAAQRPYGYSAAEMIGQPIGRLAPPGAETEEDVSLERIRRGEAVEPYDAIRLTKDWRLVDVSLSVSPVKDGTGRIVGSSRITRDITAEKRVRRDLDGLRWMLSPVTPTDSPEQPSQTSFRHLAEGNTVRAILDAAGETLLAEIAATFHSLMGTFFAVHEANGDLTYSVLAADWYRFLDASPIPHVVREAPKWLSQGSPGAEACVQAMACGKPVDLESTGGLRIYAVPVHSGVEVVGAISLGYGAPTRDPFQLAQLAEHLGAQVSETAHSAAAYETRPPFIVALAKERLIGSARLLGEIVQRHRGEVLLRQTTEHLARSNQELEQYAYVASHDLQEPLRMVASFTQLLAQRYGDKFDQDGRDFIGFAVDGATRMKQLIEDLLAYSRVTAKGRPMAVVDTRNSITLALRNLGAAILESGAEVDYDGLPPVRADGFQMVQLFQNLVGNAIKFRTPGVAPRVHIEAGHAPGDPRQWQFRVSDNGIGIEPKHFDRVFAIFQRLHTRREYPGTGIGLALCRRIVESYQGRIWVESEPGKGTAFLFTLPEVNPEKGEACPTQLATAEL